jgi:protein SCO1/2
MNSTTLTAVALAGLMLAAPVLADPPADANARQDGHGHSYAPPDLSTLGGPFSLSDEHGATVTDKDFRGRFVLLYFGYGRCAEACPTVLNTMAAAVDALGPAADRIAPVFVDFDLVNPTPAPPPAVSDASAPRPTIIGQPAPAPHPHADRHDAHGQEPYGAWTKDELGAWVRGFHPRFVALTGTRQQIFDVLRAYRVRREHLPARSGKEMANGYRVDHTTHVYVLDPEGKVAAVFYYGESGDQMAAKLRAIMAQHDGASGHAG